MIYIFCALYHEAEPLIREYGLKKKTDETCFPVFFSEEENILLTVTGCGMNAATAAVARICTKRTPQPADFLVNIGTCAKVSYSKGSGQTCRNVSEKETAAGDGLHSSDKRKTVQEQSVKAGEVYLCKKIMEHVTGRTFYPDILYRHPFEEAEIVTGAMLYHTENKTELIPKYETAIKNSVADGFLYDMEASSIYQAGAYFFGPPQMQADLYHRTHTDKPGVLKASGEVLQKYLRYLQKLRYSRRDTFLLNSSIHSHRCSSSYRMYNKNKYFQNSGTPVPPDRSDCLSFLPGSGSAHDVVLHSPVCVCRIHLCNV